MTTTNKTPEANNFKGLDEHTQITRAALADGRARDDSDPNGIGYVLTMTAGHLIERAYGPYLLTISPKLDETARMAALYVYASHIHAMPVRFDAWLGDPAACCLIGGIAQLLPNGIIGVDASPATGHRRIRITGTDTDRRMYGILDAINLPDRSRYDAAYVRERIADSARRYRPAILQTVGERYARIPETIGALAGDTWPTVAEMLTGGEAI
ncbi:hypothetical protein [Bifidobacterium callitrichos]|uniref:3-methyl-2-oxobutanoate hydroxymethyltransferase n=1 Tax=Bifidobacterium callitrichos DSM 23973 TaxID=1437609 RepID=A0A087A913_9BIFI|nr:hypothetical protein [Bifidobacterium callitrichos]KFI55263.1 3-methyl-2-oxobutanoate hydroxymethyltransferase [Bifidobacterium callitrichos DSM 23973]